jgi:iron complex transport system permease protein
MANGEGMERRDEASVFAPSAARQAFIDAGNRNALKVAVFALPFVIFLFSLFIGRYEMGPADVIRVLIAALPFTPALEQSDTVFNTVVFHVRLPRILGAMLIGGGLSIAGAVFQGLFRNPLVSPDILGVSAGAGFGAALAILVAGGAAAVQGSAFVFGIAAVLTTYGISRIYKGSGNLVMVLAGIIVGALFSALLSLLKYVADPYDTLPAIIFWLMGSLAAITFADILTAGPPIVIASAILLTVRWRINIIAVGEEEAQALGVDTKLFTRIIVLCATVITASAVCISGIIGWVGLIIPHFARMIFGPDFRQILPASMLIGAAYLLIVDDLARCLCSLEIPIGILTALLGAPFFAYLLTKKKVGWL